MFLAALDLIKPTNLPQKTADNSAIIDILNIIFVIAGALAFLMIVIAGFRYIVSQGDPNKVSESKRMILFSLVGLIVIAFAASIVNFVIERVQ